MNKYAVATLFNVHHPEVVGKTHQLVNGALESKSTPNINIADMHLIEVGGMCDFAETLKGLQAGKHVLQYQVPAPHVNGATQIHYSPRNEHEIARTGSNFKWPDNHGVMMFDVDTVISHDNLLPAMYKAAPALATAKLVWCPSSSSNVYVNGQQVHGLRGQRLYAGVMDAGDIPRAALVLFKRLWLDGHGYIEIRSNGQMREKTLIDKSVYDDVSLDYAAGAYCHDGVTQERAIKIIETMPGAGVDWIDTRTTFPDLTPDEERQYAELVDAAKADNAQEAKAVEDAAVAARVARGEGSEGQIRQALSGERSELPKDFVIHMRRNQTVTIAEILADPATYQKKQCCAPVEPDYRGFARTATIFPDTKTIVDHAHGMKRVYQMGTTQEKINDMVKLLPPPDSAQLPPDAKPVTNIHQLPGVVMPPVTPVEQPDAYISHDIFIYRHDRRGDSFYTIPPEELEHHDVPTLLTLSDAEIDERRAQVHIEQGWTPDSKHVLQSATWTAHEVETAAYNPTSPDPATLPRRPWLVTYFNQRGYLTGVIGAPGVSKTMFLIALGMHLASGRNYGGLMVAGSKPLRVLIVLAEEDPLEINLRMAAAAEHFGIQPDAMADRIAVMPMEGARRFNIGRSNGRGFEYDEDNVDFINKILDRHEVDMVLADPLGKLHDGEENDNVQMKMIVRRLTQIAQERQIGMVLAHHTPKLQGGEIAGNMWAARGASAIAAEFKVMNTLSTMTDEDADHLGVDRAERKRYCRRDDAKANNSLESSDVNWYERKSIILANGENVGVLVPKFFENVALKITPEIRNGFVGLVRQRLEAGDPIKVGTNHRNSGMVLMQYATGHDIEISDRACSRLVREWIEKGFLITEQFRFDRNTERLVLQPPKTPEYCGG